MDLLKVVDTDECAGQFVLDCLVYMWPCGMKLATFPPNTPTTWAALHDIHERHHDDADTVEGVVVERSTQQGHDEGTGHATGQGDGA